MARYLVCSGLRRHRGARRVKSASFIAIPMLRIVECPNCFHQVRIDPALSPNTTRCLKCGQEFSVAEDPAAAYGLGVRPCPHCGKDCAPAAAICIECGYDFQGRKQHKTRHQPYQATWKEPVPLVF